jgi:hypothetical protein
MGELIGMGRVARSARHQRLALARKVEQAGPALEQLDRAVDQEWNLADARLRWITKMMDECSGESMIGSRAQPRSV